MNKLPYTLSNKIEKEHLLLKAQIVALQQKLDRITQETFTFETFLRSKLMEELIEEQELSVIYKKLKLAKKEKRREQKKRGKNYQEPTGLKLHKKVATPAVSEEEQKEKKRLYREVLLQIHPDKFSMTEDKIELATEATCKLIEIYQTGNLHDLRIYHAQLIQGSNLHQNRDTKTENKIPTVQLSYLKNKKKKLLILLEIAKNKHTYKVLTEYEDPLLFVAELKSYYRDRIAKLRKRTRKAK